jgi:predicted amidohydrolase YtcJ
MTILDRDVFEVDPMEILGARVVGTMVGGAFVWRAY